MTNYTLVAPHGEKCFRRYRREVMQGTVCKRRIAVTPVGKSGAEVLIEGFAPELLIY